MDGWTDGWMDGWMDGRTDGRMDGWTDGWMDGWIGLMDERVERIIVREIMSEKVSDIRMGELFKLSIAEFIGSCDES